MRIGMRDSGSSRVRRGLSTQLRASDGAYRIGASTAGDNGAPLTCSSIASAVDVATVSALGVECGQ